MSSFCGCLGLEVGKNGCYAYNAQLLKAGIEVLENLKASFLLVSHFEGFVRRKEEVIAELRTIYEKRNPSVPVTEVGRTAE